MLLQSVRLTDFRNYAELAFTPQPGLNVFTGDNAQGKSNLLEALALLGIGKSFRAGRDSELIRTGAERADVGGEARLRAGVVHVRASIVRVGTGARKRFALNDADVAFARFLGAARVVTFVPADLGIASGGPALRRTLLNGALAQMQPTYYRALARYTRALRQKSALLRGAAPIDRDLLLAYNDALVAPAAAIMTARAAFVAELADEVAAMYARWEGTSERLTVRYTPNVGGADEPAARMQAALEQSFEAELRRRTTLVGPHRDDLALLLAGDALAAYGSQGQQRTAVLALKVAEYVVMRNATGDAPILLLDDVLSELDPTRARGFLTALGSFEQAFLTATSVPAEVSPAALYRIVAARVTRC